MRLVQATLPSVAGKGWTWLIPESNFSFLVLVPFQNLWTATGCDQSCSYCATGRVMLSILQGDYVLHSLQGGSCILCRGSCSPNVVPQTKWWGRHRSHSVSALLLVSLLQVTLAGLAGKEVEEFRNEIPYKMTEAPWFYNGTLEQGKRVSESCAVTADHAACDMWSRRPFRTNRGKGWVLWCNGGLSSRWHRPFSPKTALVLRSRSHRMRCCGDRERGQTQNLLDMHILIILSLLGFSLLSLPARHRVPVSVGAEQKPVWRLGSQGRNHDVSHSNSTHLPRYTDFRSILTKVISCLEGFGSEMHPESAHTP